MRADQLPFTVVSLIEIAAALTLLIASCRRGDFRYARLTALGAFTGAAVGAIVRFTPFSAALVVVVTAAVLPPFVAALAGALVARTQLGALIFAAFTACVTVAAMALTVFGPTCIEVRFDASCVEPIAEILGFYGIAPFIVLGVPATLFAHSIVAKTRTHANP